MKPSALFVSILMVVALLPAGTSDADPARAMRALALDTSTPADEFEWKNLADLLTKIRQDAGIPGIAAAIVQNGRIVDMAAVGLRAAGTDDSVSVDDRWHIGSVTKSMTAVVVGAVVESGRLSWDTTIEDVLGDIDMQNAYRRVTVAQLLRHRGGVPHQERLDQSEEKRLASLEGTATEQRFTFVREILEQPPAGPVGEFRYSNAGYVVVACMAERVSGKCWESLMESHVFKPIGMTHAGFGWPATSATPEQPRGHFLVDGIYHVQGYGEYELGAYIAPAGDVHASIDDLARYAIAHINGLNGKDGCVSAATMRYLHDPLQGSGPQSACGWMIIKTEYGTAHAHGGSAGTMLAHIEIYPETQRGIVLTMNVGVEGSAAARRIIDIINARAASGVAQ